MQIQTSIDNIRAALITEFAKAYIPSRVSLGIGNIYQVGTIMALHQDAINTIQLAYEGTLSLSDYGGGNWRRDWTLGVGIFVETSQDSLDRNTQAAKDVLTIASSCSQVIHLFDDFDDTEGDGAIVSTMEMVQQISESAIDLISINDHEYLTVHQAYRIVGLEYDYASFKGLN
ncbi:MAG: hypothetical protein KOO65_08535 [Desulfobacterales bacterium]|nr:hypothetical protein [Desulfobacterales bacterium]